MTQDPLRQEIKRYFYPQPNNVVGVKVNPALPEDEECERITDEVITIIAKHDRALVEQILEEIEEEFRQFIPYGKDPESFHFPMETLSLVKDRIRSKYLKDTP